MDAVHALEVLRCFQRCFHIDVRFVVIRELVTTHSACSAHLCGKNCHLVLSLDSSAAFLYHGPFTSSTCSLSVLQLHGSVLQHPRTSSIVLNSVDGRVPCLSHDQPPLIIRKSNMQRRINIAAFVLAATASLSSSLSIQNQKKNNAKTINTFESRRSFVETGAVAAFGIAASTLAQPQQAFAAEASGLPARGAKAPEFELPNSRGSGLVTLDSLVKSSKWTVLYFYPGAFTSGCTLEARGFQRDLESYRKLNAQIVGVSVDPVEKNAQFCTEEKLDFFMLSDKGGQVSKKYGSALSIPGFGTFSNRQTYIIDPKGELRWIFTDVESKISRHSSEVLEKLTELEKV